MRQLPSEYDPITAIIKGNMTVESNSYYFDTGIIPTNDTEVNCMFECSAFTGTEYTNIFGSRTTNSNTSAGQLNFWLGLKSYFGYGSVRKAFNRTDRWALDYYFSNKANVMQLNTENVEILEVDTTAATFTGTRPMFVMAMNNAGTPMYGTKTDMALYFMSVKQGGQTVSELYPARKNDGQIGLYDTVRDIFITPSGTSSYTYDNYFETRSDGNGKAFFRTPHGEYSKVYYRDAAGHSSQLTFSYADISIEAEPNDGYVFSHWENGFGGIVSYDRVLNRFPNGVVITGIMVAKFKKVSTDIQENSFMLLGIQYGEGEPSGDVQANEFDIYSLIKSFSVKEDGLTKTTSKIELGSVPSAYQVNMPVAIYTNKGKFIWAGLIESIEGNTLNCREALSIYDEDFVFVPNASWGGLNLTQYTLVSALQMYTEKFFTLHTSSTTAFTDTNDASIRKGKTIADFEFDRTLSYDNSKNVSLTMPLITELETKNLEDYLLELFNSTGYGLHAKIQKTQHTDSGGALSYKSSLLLEYYYPNRDTILSLSDNYENITNVKVNVESQQATVLEIYSANGATCRGVYGMQTDGTISDMVITQDKPLSSFIGYSDCKTAVVLSDDNLNTILVQNLTNAMFNHNITFELDLTHGMYTLDDFPIGRRVRFYVGNKMYESVLTGKEYELAANEHTIRSVKITLGKVRNSLTAKVKLSSLKKK